MVSKAANPIARFMFLFIGCLSLLPWYQFAISDQTLLEMLSENVRENSK